MSYPEGRRCEGNWTNGELNEGTEITDINIEDVKIIRKLFIRDSLKMVKNTDMVL